jgi:hypothetical protein
VGNPKRKQKMALYPSNYISETRSCGLVAMYILFYNRVTEPSLCRAIALVVSWVHPNADSQRIDWPICQTIKRSHYHVNASGFSIKWLNISNIQQLGIFTMACIFASRIWSVTTSEPTGLRCKSLRFYFIWRAMENITKWNKSYRSP